MFFDSMVWGLLSRPQKHLQVFRKLEMNMIFTEASQDSRSSALPKGTGFCIGMVKDFISYNCSVFSHGVILFVTYEELTDTSISCTQWRGLWMSALVSVFIGTCAFCLITSMSQLMQHHGCKSHLRDRNKLTGLDDRFDMVVDANDVILEKVVCINFPIYSIQQMGSVLPQISLDRYSRGRVVKCSPFVCCICLGYSA